MIPLLACIFEYEAEKVSSPDGRGGRIPSIGVIGGLLEFPGGEEETVYEVVPGEDSLCLASWG